jgi:chromosome segregation ATPase
VIPTGQWEQLKQNNHLLELKLEEVKLQLEMLSKQSSELNLKLEEAEKQLMISKQELENSNLSLANAKDLQQKARQSLTTLSEQIEAERAKQEAIQNRLRVQRTFAYILLALSVASK